MLFLEKENMHLYKRVYLLTTIAVSLVIPFITFTSYVEVIEQITPMVTNQYTAVVPFIVEEESVSYLAEILWAVYGLGALLFGLKFFKNINEITVRVRKNPKEKLGKTTSVLLSEDIAPHTFFNFIFLNKIKHLTNQIPNEVMLHEQAHAAQKHSIDVLLLELLQVVFWFNPIIYLLKEAIKLNHEFLADQAVLNHGTNTKTYQKTLLAYSSHAYQELPITIGMANATNYSSIKKRFTVMRTQTSKKKFWISSFILLPVLALVLFSFSTTVQHEKASPQQVTEYNALAKKYNEQPKNSMVVKLKDVSRLDYLYKLMTPSQKKKAEKFPNFPPPPPAKKSTMRVAKDFYTYKNNNGEEVKVEMHYEGHKDFIAIPPPPPIPENATEEQKVAYSKTIEKYKQRVASEKRMLDEADKRELANIPPPPVSTLNFVKRKAKAGAKFYFDKKAITSREAIAIVEKNSEINLSSKNLIVHLSTEPIESLEKERPIILVNGKTPCEKCILDISKEKLAAIVLSVDKGEIISFKIRFSKKPIVNVKNSTVLNKEAKMFLAEAQVGQMVQLFALKSSAFKHVSNPVIFKIIE